MATGFCQFCHYQYLIFLILLFRCNLFLFQFKDRFLFISSQHSFQLDAKATFFVYSILSINKYVFNSFSNSFIIF